jgi:hypothetical protein
MKNKSQPYSIVYQRIDVVTKVPQWAKDVIKLGDKVFRSDSVTVTVIRTKRVIGLGCTYTKFVEHQAVR